MLVAIFRTDQMQFEFFISPVIPRHKIDCCVIMSMAIASTKSEPDRVHDTLCKMILRVGWGSRKLLRVR